MGIFRKDTSESYALVMHVLDNCEQSKLDPTLSAIHNAVKGWSINRAGFMGRIEELLRAGRIERAKQLVSNTSGLRDERPWWTYTKLGWALTKLGVILVYRLAIVVGVVGIIFFTLQILGWI